MERNMEKNELTEYFIKAIQEKDKKIEELQESLRKLTKIYGMAVKKLVNTAQHDFIKASFINDEIGLKKEKDGSYSIFPKRFSFDAEEIPEHMRNLLDKEEKEPGYIYKNCYFMNVVRDLDILREDDNDEETEEDEDDEEEDDEESEESDND